MRKAEGESRKILVCAGTRPEAIKMVPVFRALRARPDRFEVQLCSTGQHREMLRQAFADFGVAPDVELDVMVPNQSLAGLSARLFDAIDGLLAREHPHVLLVQGDTTTVQIAALCAFYRGILVGHVEAGLRSHNLRSPFPEELNRRIAGMVSDLHFAPTDAAKKNLLAEGVPADRVFVTGNTVIDALLWMAEDVRRQPPPLPREVESLVTEGRRFVLITGHRRESFGSGFEHMCEAIRQLASSHPDVFFVYPVHLNPHVRGPVHAILDGIPSVCLIEPQSYKPFVRLMDACTLIMTDSGGVQEEAPSMGKPVLVMRDVTERMEGVHTGVCKLVGTDTAAIVREASRLLDDSAEYDLMAKATNPYGDGHAAERIVSVLDRWKMG
jgi:UDP-N-acetylglucosamine 2-epimerase